MQPNILPTCFTILKSPFLHYNDDFLNILDRKMLRKL